MSARVLVVGGTGSFGRRLVDHLLATTDAILIVAGRSVPTLETVASDLRARHPGRAVETARLDRASATAAEIAALDPAVVVDAAGPFQGADLAFVRATIAGGRHYVDIADARDFVAAFPTLDDEARKAGVVAVCGASSTPALSNAALGVLTAGWRRVDRVEVAISPGNRAARGLSVASAILSYAGAPVCVLQRGRWRAAPGWGLLVRRRMPGLGARWLSLCETPDLDLIPARRPEVETALFRAGLELSILHLGLFALSLLKRSGVVGDLARFAGSARGFAAAFDRLGTDRGGMLVEAEGIDASGAPARAGWSLVAEAGDGPNVPVLPAAAVVRALLAGRPPAPPGAHVAAGLVTLEEFGREAARFAIRTRIDRASPDAGSVFARALGLDLARLPDVVRRVHDPQPRLQLAGTVDVEGAETAAGRLIARLFGFPPTLAAAPAEVEIARDGQGEIWTRRFAGARFVSRVAGAGGPGLLTERFGPLAFDLAIDATENGFSLAVEGWRAFGLPMPLRLAPTTRAHGFAHPDGTYGFDVEIGLGPVGRLVRYRGRLVPLDRAEQKIAADGMAPPAAMLRDQRPQ